jgi:hypothetical protein
VGPLNLSIHYATLPVGHSPTSSFDGFGSAMSVLFDQCYIYYYFVYDLIPILIERLGLTWLLIFSVGDHIRVWILLCFYYIILFSRFIWDLSMPKGLYPLAPSWYRESRELSFSPWLVQRVFYLYYISFCLYTDSYLILAIWQLKSYSNPFIFIL